MAHRISSHDVLRQCIVGFEEPRVVLRDELPAHTRNLVNDIAAADSGPKLALIAF